MLDYAQHNSDENSRMCLDKSRQYLQLSIEEIHKLSKSLNTSAVKDMDLINQVEDIVNNMKLSRSVSVRVECSSALEEKIYSDLKLMIYTIIQEQTDNIIEYAEATEEIISLRKSRTSLHLSIKDDGKG